MTDLTLVVAGPCPPARPRCAVCGVRSAGGRNGNTDGEGGSEKEH